ncbi:MAG: PDZ domain-containing protein [Phycisphaerales bacterium]|nr:PDZ domain-containing protein [Phycisphaerales bacterium]
MQTRSRLSALFCASASLLVAASAAQAQVAVQKRDSTDTVIVRPSRTNVTSIVTSKAPPDGEKQDIRIERKVVDGEDQIQLWVNGQQIEVDDMDELREALKDLDIQVFDEDDLDGGAMELFKVDGPGALNFQVDAEHLKNLGETFAGANFGLWTQPKSMLGVHLAPISSDLRDYLGLGGDAGVRVQSIVEDSPAASAGLQAGDIIVSATVGEESFESVAADELRKAIAAAEPETKVSLTVMRRGEKKTIEAALVQWKADQFGLVTEGDHMLQFMTPESLNRQIEIESLPQIRSFRLTEPQIRRFQLDTEQMLRQAAPDMEEMMRQMDEQMQRVREMLEQIQQQQTEIRRQVQETPQPDA